MLFALLLFIVMTVLGVNLLNAAYANTENTNRELENQQRLLYLSSAFEVINEMIVEGKFYDSTTNLMPLEAKANLPAHDKTFSVVISFSEKAGGLTAKMAVEYEGKKYHMSSLYKKDGAAGKYKLERCYGIEEP